MDHDRLFKLLLTTFFAEFIELFLPQVAEQLDRDSIEFLDKEIFTDIRSGERHEVDLLAKVRLRGQETFILVHVENQATPQSDFPRRMFDYFGMIHKKFGLSVYPIALFSFDKPITAAADQYSSDVLDLDVLRFKFKAIQLNRLDWRVFLNNPNPVASALMTKMHIDPVDRPRVKAQSARMMATLRLDPARSGLIWKFMSAYLPLTSAEEIVYTAEMETLADCENEFASIAEKEWTRVAEMLGSHRGRTEMMMRMLFKRFGQDSITLTESVSRLSRAQVDLLGDALFDFTALDEVKTWLADPKN